MYVYALASPGSTWDHPQLKTSMLAYTVFFAESQFLNTDLYTEVQYEGVVYNSFLCLSYEKLLAHTRALLFRLWPGQSNHTNGDSSRTSGGLKP